MKLLFILFLISNSVFAQYKVTTRYKAGFSYHDNCGNKITLYKWEQGRWKAYIQSPIVNTPISIFTDDEWIDVYTHKAFLNERTHQIVYYDSVDIVPKKKVQYDTGYAPRVHRTSPIKLKEGDRIIIPLKHDK